MRLSHIIQAVYMRPWLITASGWKAIDALVQSKLAGEVAHPIQADAGLDFFGDPLPAPYKVGKTAVIPIRGVIGRRLGSFEKSCGACDTMDIESAIIAAEADSSIDRIILDIDSPGGTVTGVPEAAQVVASAHKQVVAVTEGMICSAAYWLASGADSIYATKTADVGSIGVYQAWVDSSLNYAMDGYKAEIIKAGKYKAEGYPGTSISPEYRAMLQAEVDQIYGWFTAHVTAQRPQITNATMQGQTFMGEAAANAGLIDGIAERGLADILNS